ncbi:hypothetical protein C8J95_105100 [Elizabethkingia sp. YR214]|uniref:alkyl hydroperoxide reductase n=1 Tax=Elizabethkingia sp. YR214 TaxID=2135667 RepID=UPI000D469C1D|nr:alkyl hydroperoxide reductase [Elizabethkingia sp. YR214]PUB30782.1 hypothetical protein C8J95_105100 [Elizabethkingia sp. YR214]
MIRRVFILFILMVSVFEGNCQTINMSFPKFAGKEYEFVIFQGNEYKKILQSTIPGDGKFSIIIPKEYKGYEGMSRWLLRTEEGGGLDLYIPGYDFDISCESDKPNESNVHFTNNTDNAKLNKLYREQEKILNKYQSMLMAIKSYSEEEKKYKFFEAEMITQKAVYEDFQEKLMKDGDYICSFLQIVNITNGLGTKLYEEEKMKALNISNFIVKEMKWDRLYNSGHWMAVIEGWVNIHTKVLKNKKIFASSYGLICLKLNRLEMYRDFTERVEYFLKQQNETKYLESVSKLNIKK